MQIHQKETQTGLYPEEEYCALLSVAIDELEKIIREHECDHSEGKCPCFRWRIALISLRKKYSQEEQIL